jgi:hypothetical protein
MAKETPEEGSIPVPVSNSTINAIFKIFENNNHIWKKSNE